MKTLCASLLGRPHRDQQPSRSSPLDTRDTDQSPALRSDASSSSSHTWVASASRSTENGHESPHIYEQHQDLLFAWTKCLERLLGAVRLSLVDTYKQWEPDASPAMIEQLLQDTKFRKHIISRLRTASKGKKVSSDLDFFPRYVMQFRDHDKLKLDVTEMRRLLQDSESGILPDRAVEEIIISPRGDSVLEFANGVADEFPVLRFRVSSHLLAETSPIFAQMFNGSAMTHAGKETDARDSRQALAESPCCDGDIMNELPPTPTRYVCKDGTEVNLFRMPQLELNLRHSLEILLHAAHMHNDKVPREIDFGSFVAIAEVSIRYQCTAPLELTVEYLWLPQWMHKATEEMPAGLLLISYAFGLRRLFTRMSKTAILNVADKEDLDSLPWPQKIKDKVWATRAAKMGQVYHCCNSLLQEYLRCPPSTPPSVAQTETTGLVPTIKPRCSRGSHSCDAICLGWLMMLFNEMQVLPQIMHTASIKNRPPPPRRSLNQLLASLKFMAGPPHIHSGPCDFATTFRADTNDIYNSIAGLTLFDVSGKHGWALSKNKGLPPQPVFKVGALLPDLDAAKRTLQEVAIQILQELDDPEDLHNLALVNNAFFEAFKTNEIFLLRGLIRKVKDSNPQRWTLGGAKSRAEARAEMKSIRDSNIDIRESGQVMNEAEAGTKSHTTLSTVSNRSSIEQSAFDESSDTDTHMSPETEYTAGVNMTHGLEEKKMTREEAERILWPEDDKILSSRQDNIPVSSNNQGHSGTTAIEELPGPTEKFRVGDLVWGHMEEKSLPVKEDKNLSQEHYERIGLVSPTSPDRVESISGWV